MVRIMPEIRRSPVTAALSTLSYPPDGLPASIPTAPTGSAARSGIRSPTHGPVALQPSETVSNRHRIVVVSSVMRRVDGFPPSAESAYALRGAGPQGPTAAAT